MKEAGGPGKRRERHVSGRVGRPWAASGTQRKARRSSGHGRSLEGPGGLSPGTDSRQGLGVELSKAARGQS